MEDENGNTVNRNAHTNTEYILPEYDTSYILYKHVLVQYEQCGLHTYIRTSRQGETEVYVQVELTFPETVASKLVRDLTADTTWE